MHSKSTSAQGFTCLHEAVRCGQEAAATLVLACGANVDLKTSEVTRYPAKDWLSVA